jgi:hypothetical protein
MYSFYIKLVIEASPSTISSSPKGNNSTSCMNPISTLHTENILEINSEKDKNDIMNSKIKANIGNIKKIGIQMCKPKIEINLNNDK